MKKIDLLNIFYLLAVTILYFFMINFKIYNPFTYIMLLILITLSIFLSNRFKFFKSNSLFTLYFLYSVGLGPFVLLSKKIFYNFDYYTIILGAFLCFSWGNLLSIKIINSSVKEINDKNKIRFKIPRKKIIYMLFALSFLSSLIYIYQNKSFLLSSDINSGRISSMSGSGLLLYAMQFSILLVPMLYDLYFYGKKTKTKVVKKMELFALLGISSILLLFTGFRAPLATLYICLIILIIEKNNIKNGKLIPIGVLMITLVEFMGLVRSNTGDGFSINKFIESFSTTLYVGSINLKYIFNIFPSKVPFQNGYTYLINFIMLMPGPNLDFTLWLKEQLNINFSGGGVTPTIIGEFYINFGLPAIYFGMFLMGIIGNLITKYFNKHKKTFLGAFYIWEFAHCVSGGIANVSIIVLIFTILYWFLMMFPETINKGDDTNEK